MSNYKYNENFPKLVEDYAGQGFNDSQIAKKMGICRASFYIYKRQYPEFAEALECGRDEADGNVENRLYRLALGGFYTETVVKYDDGRTRTTVKQAVPNLKAAICWLERSEKRKAAEAARIQTSQPVGPVGHLPALPEIAAPQAPAEPEPEAPPMPVEPAPAAIKTVSIPSAADDYVICELPARSVKMSKKQRRRLKQSNTPALSGWQEVVIARDILEDWRTLNGQ